MSNNEKYQIVTKKGFNLPDLYFSHEEAIQDVVELMAFYARTEKYGRVKKLNNLLSNKLL